MLKFLLARKTGFVVGKGLEFALPDSSGFLCLFLHVPNEKEVTKVSRLLGVDAKLFKSYPHASRSVRYSVDPLSFALVDYFLENGEVRHSRLLFVLKKNILLIATPGASAYYEGMFDRMATDLKALPVEKVSLSRLLYEFLDEDVEENYEVIEASDARIIALEEQLVDFERATPERLKEIISLKRELSKMSRRFWASAKVIMFLKRGAGGFSLDAESFRLLDDLYDSYVHQVEMVSGQKEMLSDALAVFETSLSNRLAAISIELNEIMKKLTAFTVLIMLPTMIASIYGMNLVNLPLAQHEFALEFTVALMAAVAFLAYRYFHKKGYI